MTGTSFVLELVPHGGENEFEPRPQNEILVPFRSSFQNFRRSPPSLLHGSPSPGLWTESVLFKLNNYVSTRYTAFRDERERHVKTWDARRNRNLGHILVSWLLTKRFSEGLRFVVLFFYFFIFSLSLPILQNEDPFVSFGVLQSV